MMKAGVSRAQVVEENKRQLCIYKPAERGKKEAWKWWDYAAGFAAECTMANGRFGGPLLRARTAGEDRAAGGSAVDSCMGDSSSDNTHELLQVRPRTEADRLVIPSYQSLA